MQLQVFIQAIVFLCGLGGIARAIVTWMVERGVPNLVFFSRSAGTTSQDQAFLCELELQGCAAITIEGEVTILEDVQTAVQACPRPIGGVLRLSMVIRMSKIQLWNINKENTDKRRINVFQR
jgi:hypothetical protein